MAADRGSRTRRQRGNEVEDAASRHLAERGLTLVARNVGYRVGEIDLVMRDARGSESMLVFVEVRYRASDAYGGGVESVDQRKRRRLIRAAQCFLQQHPHLAAMPCRFDVVDASGDPQAPTLHWIEDAFRADD